MLLAFLTESHVHGGSFVCLLIFDCSLSYLVYCNTWKARILNLRIFFRGDLCWVLFRSWVTIDMGPFCSETLENDGAIGHSEQV